MLPFGATADPDIPEAVSFHPTLVKGVVDVVVGYDCCRSVVRPSVRPVMISPVRLSVVSRHSAFGSN